MQTKIFNELTEFCDFVNSYEGELTVSHGKAYDKQQIVAQYHKIR